jgi:hypothetical protein
MNKRRERVNHSLTGADAVVVADSDTSMDSGLT